MVAIADTITPQQLELRRRIRAVWICIAASTFVCLVELLLGWYLDLSSLIAEGVHTFLDGFDSIIVLITVHLAARPADRNHQFGHGKFEAIGASIEGAFLLVAALGIGYEAVHNLIKGHTPERIPFYASLVMIGASALYAGISVFLMREARATKSPAVLAEALHLTSHIYITAGLAIGLLIGAIGDYPIVDNLLSLAVALCLVYIGLHIFHEVYRQFTDASLPRDEIDRMAALIEPFCDRFVEVHGLRTRQSGAERHIEMHLVVLPDTTVADAHALGHEIEDAVMRAWPTTRMTVHIEPLNTADRNYHAWIKGQPKVRTNDATPNDREFIH